MSGRITVRPAVPSDAAGMARVHVESWRATYRGLMPDAVLDDPGFTARRVRFWTAALTDERFAANRVVVAEADGEVVGIAMSGPPAGAGTGTDRDVDLYVLYLLDGHHGSGAGSALLDAVIEPTERAALWVADPNPRAQAFYRKRGFVPDGAEQVEDGVREIRMVRPPEGRVLHGV